MTAATLRSTFRTTIFPWRYHLLLLLGAFTGGWASILGRKAKAYQQFTSSLFGN